MDRDYNSLSEKAKELRMLILKSISVPGSGHVGGSFSIVETLVALYNGIMNIDPKDPKKPDRDRFILSKGHAGPGMYAALAQRGYFDKELLMTLNTPNTNLPSHTDMNKTVGVDMTTGSLGQGISCAVGMAYASKLKNDGNYIYCMIGDGESQEGQVWEAAVFAAGRKLNNFICFLDYNKLQLDGSLETVNPMGDMKAKWEAFGFYTQDIDGHDFAQIFDAVEKAKAQTDKPSMIILNTVKGKGVSFIEEMKYKNHSMPVDQEVIDKAQAELYA